VVADDYDSTRIFQGRLSRLICEESDFDAPLARSTPRTSAAATTSKHAEVTSLQCDNFLISFGRAFSDYGTAKNTKLCKG